MARFRSRNPLTYALPVGGALLAGAVGVAAYAARSINTPRRRQPYEFTFTPWEVQVEHEPVSFPSTGDVTIRGWWFARPESQRVIIVLTGYHGAKHEMLGIGSGLWRAGNNVLLFDYRGCGESDSGPTSLAHHELQDARAAVRFVRERMPDAHIGLIGYSMGGAIAILLAASDPTVEAVVADSPFATMRDVIAQAYQRRRVPAQPFIGLTDVMNRWRYGYPFRSIRPLDVVGQIAPRPLLLIHGTRDQVVPVTHAAWLYAAAQQPKELWIVEGAHHCGGYFDDRQAYVKRVTDFFAQWLEQQPAVSNQQSANSDKLIADR